MRQELYQDLVELAEKLELTLDKSDALVRIEHTPKYSGQHVIANKTGMVALGLECIKASSRPSIDTKRELPLELEALEYLKGADWDRVTGLFVDNGIEYERAPTKDELEREDARFDWLSFVFNIFLWVFLGSATLGFIVSIRWLWNLVF